jgi:hypothetical protein
MSLPFSLGVRFMMWTAILVLADEPRFIFGQTTLSDSGTTLATGGSINVSGSLTMGTTSSATTAPNYSDSSTFSSYSVAIEPVSGGASGGNWTQPLPPVGGGDQIQPFPVSPGGDDVSPMPEPSTWFAATLLLGAVIYSQRRRLRCIVRLS